MAEVITYKLPLGPLHCSATRKIAGTENVFRWRRKDCNDVMETRLSGSVFQILAAATGKARLPTVEKAEGWYNEMVGVGGAERASTRYIGNAVEWLLLWVWVEWVLRHWRIHLRIKALNRFSNSNAHSGCLWCSLYASPYLWNQLPSSFRQPHCVHSPPGSPHPAHITTSQSPPSLSPSVTPWAFYSRLKTHLFHKSFSP